MAGNQETDDTVETDDIYFAAYLMYASCNYVGKRNVGPKIFLRFQNSAGSAVELQKLYYSNQATVRAHDYAQKVVAAKQLLYIG